MGKKLEIKTGDRFGRLTIIEEVKNRYRRSFRCLCDCGEYKTTTLYMLTSGQCKSCDCFRSEYVAQKNYKHGLAIRNNKHYLLYTWEGMKQRCYNPNHFGYKYYGGRDIKVCNRWLNSFEDFINDIGDRPSEEYSLDRINVNGNYEPSNCKWATSTEQAKNKRNNKKIECLT
jgi:hypothetical protein